MLSEAVKGFGPLINVNCWLSSDEKNGQISLQPSTPSRQNSCHSEGGSDRERTDGGDGGGSVLQQQGSGKDKTKLLSSSNGTPSLSWKECSVRETLLLLLPSDLFSFLPTFLPFVLRPSRTEEEGEVVPEVLMENSPGNGRPGYPSNQRFRGNVRVRMCKRISTNLRNTGKAHHSHRPITKAQNPPTNRDTQESTRQPTRKPRWSMTQHRKAARPIIKPRQHHLSKCLFSSLANRKLCILKQSTKIRTSFGKGRRMFDYNGDAKTFDSWLSKQI